MKPHEINQLVQLLDRLRVSVLSMPFHKSCIDCVNLDNGICKLAGKAPPEEIMRAGCEAYLYDRNSPPF